MPALRRFSMFADEVFQNASETLGVRARVSGVGKQMEIRIGQREPFDLAEPLVLTVWADSAIATEGGRGLTFAEGDRSITVEFGSELSEPPAAPRLRYSKTWGKTCASTNANVGSGFIQIEPVGDEVWADVFWSRVSTGPADAEIDSYLETINARQVRQHALETRHEFSVFHIHSQSK
jgi:hypothetical protein